MNGGCPDRSGLVERLIRRRYNSQIRYIPLMSRQVTVETSSNTSPSHDFQSLPCYLVNSRSPTLMHRFLPFFLFGLVSLISQTIPYAQNPGSAPAEATPLPSPAESPGSQHLLEPPSFKATSPSSSPAQPTETAKPGTPSNAKAPMTLKETVDSFSVSELREILRLLKAAYVQPSRLEEEEILRGTVQGVLERLGPGASLLTANEIETAAKSPFQFEILNDQIGYLRLGDLSEDNISELDAALSNFEKKQLHMAILDLRATPPSSEFRLASEVLRRFVPKGRLLFTIKKPNAKEERMFTSNQNPAYFGLLAIVVDDDTKGAPEVIAAVLREEKNAMVIGETTAGQGVEYKDIALQSGRKVRIAVSIVSLPENATPIFPDGVEPDIAVEVEDGVTEQILAESLKGSVSQFVFESERPRMNEAALVAGRNPDLDALQAAQENVGDPQSDRTYDRALQRAVDLLTTIAIYKRGGAE